MINENIEKYRRYVEQSPLPFLSMTEDWIVDYMNPAGQVASVLRVSEKIIGHSFYELWPLARNSLFEENYKKAMKGEVVDFEACYENHWFRIFAFPLYPGIGIYFQDVTDAKNTQKELEKAVESRDKFLSIASHELNTPLTSLKLHTQMMERMLPQGVPLSRLQKFFEQTDLQVTRLEQLVGDMLDASKIREGRLSLQLQQTDICSLVSEAIERMSPHFELSGIQIPTFKVSGSYFRATVDPGRLEQVISNLLMNAIKYGEGSPISVSLMEEDQFLNLSIHDDGPGIPECDHERVFEQYDRGGIEKGEGLGLGLFLARQIVLAHGGRIFLECKPGDGTTFIIKLRKS